MNREGAKRKKCRKTPVLRITKTLTAHVVSVISLTASEAEQGKNKTMKNLDT